MIRLLCFQRFFCRTAAPTRASVHKFAVRSEPTLRRFRGTNDSHLDSKANRNSGEAHKPSQGSVTPNLNQPCEGSGEQMILIWTQKPIGTPVKHINLRKVPLRQVLQPSTRATRNHTKMLCEESQGKQSYF